MSGLTDDGARYIIGCIANADVPVSSYYFGLITGNAPSYSAHGNELDEPAAASYARAPYLNVSGNWSITAGVLSNTVEIDFPIASTDWGMVRYWVMCDALTGGRVIATQKVPVPSYIAAGQQPYIPVNSFSLQIPTAVWKVYL